MQHRSLTPAASSSPCGTPTAGSDAGALLAWAGSMCGHRPCPPGRGLSSPLLVQLLRVPVDHPCSMHIFIMSLMLVTTTTILFGPHACVRHTCTVFFTSLLDSNLHTYDVNSPGLNKGAVNRHLWPPWCLVFLVGGLWWWFGTTCA